MNKAMPKRKTYTTWFDLDFLATRSSRRIVFFSVSRAVSMALSCTVAGAAAARRGCQLQRGARLCTQEAERTRAVVFHSCTSQHGTHQAVQYLAREGGLLLDGAGHLFQPPHRAGQLLYFVVQVVGGARLYVDRDLVTGGRVAKQGLAGAEPRSAQREKTGGSVCTMASEVAERVARFSFSHEQTCWHIQSLLLDRRPTF